MSETLTIFGIDYPNTEGFKAKDDLGTTHTYGEGGGSGGVDIPVFEIILDNDYEEVISSSCNKTYTECYALYNNQMQSGMVNLNIESGSDEASYPVYAWGEGTESGRQYLFYVLYAPYAVNNITYWADGEIDFVYPSSLARDSSDLTVSGNTVTAPAGSYADDASATVASGTEGTPTATKGTVSNHAVSITPSVTNTTGYITGGTKTGTAVSVSASELVSGTKSISANGTGIDVTNYAAVDVAVPGSSPNLQAKTNIAPTESSQTITADSGYDGLSSVQIKAISSTYVGSGIIRRSSTDLTASGATITAPAGYYASSASTSVASGTAGTPTAAKGTVSNHSISVTPSVTNTTGYITGSTKTGTAVTVSASELVSGSETKTANGTYDVTNLASLVVAIPIVTYYTGSSAPSNSLGQNGDIYLQTS